MKKRVASVTVLACLPGDRLIDLSGKIPRGIRSMDFVVSLEPCATRFCINASPVSKDSFQHLPRAANLRESYGYRLWMDGSASDKASHK